LNRKRLVTSSCTAQQASCSSAAESRAPGGTGAIIRAGVLLWKAAFAGNGVEALARMESELPGVVLIPPERIALNPDCGFASDAGEPPTIDEAYLKLSRLDAAALRLREHCATTGKVGH
jgi:hypothetical protein